MGLVGTFGVWKGQKTFLSALARLATHRPVRGYLIGGAQYQTSGSQLSEAVLRVEAARLGIADRLGFTGPVTEPASAMRALDVVVHASTQPEPFGMVIAEAMACGRAVVISGAGGAAELVADGVDGLTHDPGNAGELAACLGRLADDDALRARLGRAARATAERRFDCRRLAAELVPLYASVVR
jgi:glycosyltransferase involved in cell wall biosynthesis